MSTELDRLVALSRLLGEPVRNLAILGPDEQYRRTAPARGGDR